MGIFCKNCGAHNLDGTKICTICGNVLEHSVEDKNREVEELIHQQQVPPIHQENNNVNNLGENNNKKPRLGVVIVIGLTVLIIIGIVICITILWKSGEDKTDKKDEKVTMVETEESTTEKDNEEEDITKYTLTDEKEDITKDTLTDEKEDITEEKSTTKKETDDKQNMQTDIVLTDYLYDFQIEINGIVYQLPMKVEDFVNAGWTYDEEEDKEVVLKAYGGAYVHFCPPESESNSTVFTTVYNFMTSAATVEDGYICHIQAELDTNGEGITSIRMAGGIECGVSSYEDLVNVYGSPTDIYDGGDGYYIYTYSIDSLQTVKFTFVKDVMTDVSVENTIVPEGIEQPELSDEIPEAVVAYQQPTELGNDITSGILELDGILYQLPVPVKELVDNGWQIQKESSDETIVGDSYANITLLKDGYNLCMGYITVYNYADYEVPVEYGFIEEISVYDTDISFRLPKNITMNSSLEEIRQIFSGIESESSSSTDYEKYQYSSMSSDENLWVTVSYDLNDNDIGYIEVHKGQGY